MLVHVRCLGGDPATTPLTSQFLVIRVDAEGSTTVLTEVGTLATDDVRLGDDSSITIGAPTTPAGDGPYQTITIRWEGESIVVDDPEPASGGPSSPSDAGIADPAAGLSPTTTTLAIPAPTDPVPAACVASEIGANTRDRPAVAALQLALNRRGFDPGGIDGLFGANSRAALAAVRGRQQRAAPEFHRR